MNRYPTAEECERDPTLCSIEEQIVHDISRAAFHIGAIGELGPGEHEIKVRGGEGAVALSARLAAHAKWLREKFSLDGETPETRRKPERVG